MWDGTYLASGGVRVVSAHRWAYGHFVAPVPDDLKVCHTCDVRRCVNFLSHLFVGTQLDNMQDMVAKGREARGEQRSALTDESVEAIRRLSERGESQRSIAKRFGITQSGVSLIVRGKVRTKPTWTSPSSSQPTATQAGAA